MKQIKKFKELDLFFQNIDYSDIKTVEGSASLRQFVSGMLSYYPWWIGLLFRIREILVHILGLIKQEKPNGLPSIKPDELSFTPGEHASFFIVRSAKEEIYWVSETPEDKHLKAYFGVIREAIDNNLSRFHVFTSVKYSHWTGPVYFNIIRPFHHLVVSRMMKAGVTKAG